MTTATTGTADDFADLLARPEATSADIFKLVAERLQEDARAKLVTVTAVDPEDLSYERLFSTMPDIYPVSGRKPANNTHWADTVMKNLDVYVANDYESLTETMADHEVIRSIGCGSLVNVPLIYFGRVIGTLNCLGTSGNFDTARIQACKDMRLPVLIGILANQNATQRAAAAG